MNRLALSLVLLMLSAPVIGEPVLSFRLDERTIWLPSTTVRAGVTPVRLDQITWVLACDGGLVFYSTPTAEATIYRVPTGSRRIGDLRVRSPITGIDRIGGELWLATHGDGVHVFDLERSEFVGQWLQSDAKLRGNLVAFRDPYTGDIWAPHFQHLDRYMSHQGLWVNHDEVFRNLGMSAPSSGRVLFDDRFVWLWFRDHGLVRHDKSTGEWTRYSGALVGDSSRRRVSVTDVLVGQEYLWVWSYSRNTLAGRLAVYDRASDEWQVHPRGRLAPAIDRLTAALPDVQWFDDRNLVRTMRQTADSARKVASDHPWVFSDDELRSFDEQTDRLEQALRSKGILEVRDHGRQRYWIADGRIREVTAEGTARDVVVLDLPSVSYDRLLGADPDGRIVVTSSGGVLRIDARTRELDRFNGRLLGGGTSRRVVPLADGRVLVLVLDSMGMDGPPSRRVYRIDVDDLEVRSVDPPMPDRLDPIGRVGNRLAVRAGADRVLQLYDPESGRWVASDNPRAELIPVEELPEKIFLPGDGRVELVDDGLVLVPPAEDDTTRGPAAIVP